MNIAKIGLLSLVIFSSSAVYGAMSSAQDSQGYGYNKENNVYDQPYETRGRNMDSSQTIKQNEHRNQQQSQPQSGIDYSEYDRLSSQEKMSQYLTGDTPYQRENPLPGQYPQSRQPGQQNQPAHPNQPSQKQIIGSNQEQMDYDNQNIAQSYQPNSYNQWNNDYQRDFNREDYSENGHNQWNNDYQRDLNRGHYSENAHQPYGYYQPQGGSSSFESSSYSAPSYSSGGCASGGCASGRCGSRW